MTELDETSPPTATVRHAVADWVELACLVSLDGFFAVPELVGARERQKDTGQASSETGAQLVLAQLDDTGDSDDGILPSQGDQALRETDPPDVSFEEAVAQVADPPVTGEIADVLAHLRSRADMLRPARYPFDVEDRGLRLRTSLGAAHGIYIALLVCSNLNRLPETGRSEWTGGFERYCTHALAGWLGSMYRVEVFGTAARAGELFHGDTRQALETLCTAVGWTLALGEEDERTLPSSGDRGLDGVAWRVDGDDPADLWVTYFVQAACGKNWPDKQDEASRDRWARFMAITSPLQSVLAIPYWQRETSKRWAKSVELSRANVFLDRYRLLSLAADAPAFAEFPTARVESLVAGGSRKDPLGGASRSNNKSRSRTRPRK
ncbi:MAG: hypothetical protein JHC95_09555 [Solirubrobacteraceae bacterium]|nr:hypothetical protein [Solirubrobacteraceae bacterium]